LYTQKLQPGRPTQQKSSGRIFLYHLALMKNETPESLVLFIFSSTKIMVACSVSRLSPHQKLDVSKVFGRVSKSLP